MTRIQMLIASLILGAIAPSVIALADDKPADNKAKTVGQELGTAAREIGQGTKEVTKSVGHTVRDATKATGHAVRDGAKEFKKAVQEDGSPAPDTNKKNEPKPGPNK